MSTPPSSFDASRSAAIRSPWIIATRESRLALWQAEHVKALFSDRFGATTELLGMTTRGDQILDRTLSKVGGKGLFVKELETALEQGAAHMAVHSLKDVPMDLLEGFVLGAVLEREDPRDAFVSSNFENLASLPRGALVGTSSLRRLVQVKALRPDLRVEPLRGNLDTRLRKLDEGGYDAIVLAAAGLKRLGLESRIRACFEPGEMVPSAGQGALGVEIRSDSTELRDLLAQLSHRPTWLAVQAERAVSRTLGGSCSMPLGAHAVWTGRMLSLTAVLGHADAVEAPLLHASVQAEVTDDVQAHALGERAAELLRESGGHLYLAKAAVEPSAGAAAPGLSAA
ncbi:MAG: hydroxymethylbilane synthase [Rhizobacter sp.]|nr:hydroxymethylbilane synthase [Rhizobacter sp.]